MIHPTAIIDSTANIHETAEIGPYAVIEKSVIVGPRCRLGPYVYVLGETQIGEGNVFHAGCVIGDAPQDLKYKGAPTRLVIGDCNVFREQVTIHRSNKMEEDTVIGSNNLFMANAHVGHNCRIGDYVTMANGALLGGHVVINDRAFISGNCLVHQFVRVGMLAMMQGSAAISMDLPPFLMARSTNSVCGLNVVGLRRAGFSADQRLELKRLYHLLFRGNQKMAAALESARQEYTYDSSRLLVDFVAASKRGVCRDSGWRSRHSGKNLPTEEGSSAE